MSSLFRFRFAAGAVVLGVVLFASGIIVGCGFERNQSGSVDRVELGGESERLRVGISDRTGRRPPSSQLTIETPGGELWRPRLRFGRALKQFAAYPAGTEHELYIYPRGQEGPRWRIPFSMEPAAASDTTSSDTHIEIYDDSLVVGGSALSNETIVLERKGPWSSGAP